MVIQGITCKQYDQNHVHELTANCVTVIHCKHDGGEVKCKSGVYSCFNTLASVSHIFNLPSWLMAEKYLPSPEKAASAIFLLNDNCVPFNLVPGHFILRATFYCLKMNKL